jgi:hypothetical protein
MRKEIDRINIYVKYVEALDKLLTLMPGFARLTSMSSTGISSL